MAKDEQYRSGYLAGYADGVRDAAQSRIKPFGEQELGQYPVNGMQLSSRAINCLTASGCEFVSDVAGLSEFQIATMRNLGKITAKEIACWMVENGIMDSAWSNFL